MLIFGTNPSSNSNQKGFTLMELMVVVAIIAILASIGLPTYKNFIAKSEASEAVEQCGAIQRLVKLYVDQHPSVAYATLSTTLSPGTGSKGNLGKGVADDEITTIIPELSLAEDATFQYDIDAEVLENREVHLCIKASKKDNSAAFILFSSKASAKEEWSGKFYDKTFLDNTVAAVAGGYCQTDGTAGTDAG